MAEHFDIIIIGGGPAGLAAAVSARRAGIDSVLIIERDKVLGGILNQCVHNGFGIHTFGEELTGPEYADRYVRMVEDMNIPAELDTMVLDFDADRVLTVVSPEKGLRRIHAGAIILAMGCRERPRGALNIPGYRPAGIYTAGTAQRLINIDGYMPGRDVVILGSGDIGLITARRMALEDARVRCVAELMPYSGGLRRNIVQCLDDFDIPLLLSHTVVEIHGRERLTGVTLAQVDEKLKPIAGTEKHIPCDTLLLSVGLLPENELSRQAGVELSSVTGGPVVDGDLSTSIPGVFACGNVLHVHDLVDWVSLEAETAGKNAADFVKNGKKPAGERVYITPGPGVRYTVPSYVEKGNIGEKVTVRFRVADRYKNASTCALAEGKVLSKKKRMVMAPGEMEELIIDGAALENAASVTVFVEE